MTDLPASVKMDLHVVFGGPVGDLGAVRGPGHLLVDLGNDLAVEHGGDDVLLRQLVLPHAGAIARAAAIFISSLMQEARESSAPRKMPGKASTLVIWYG